MQKVKVFMMGILVSTSLISVGFVLGVADAGDQVDVSEYEVGDYWIYDSTLSAGISGEARVEVEAIVNYQDYWGETHECYEISSTMDYTMYISGSSIDGSASIETYRRTEDLFVIETDIELSISFLGTDQTTSQLQYSQWSETANIYPLILGSETPCSFTTINTFIVDTNGDIMTVLNEELVVVEMEVSITDTLQTITTPAGTFECVEITTINSDPEFTITTISYYSEEVGATVKSELISNMTLIPS
jgi:hypothetical protein